MKVSRFAQMVVVIMLTALLFAPPADAQGQGRNRRGERNYDPATVATVTATVQEVSTESGRGGGSGLHLALQTEDGPTVVHLGPASYLSANGMAFKAGDTVTVTGSKTVIDGEPALIAREIQRGGIDLSLRDEAGIPDWRGQGQRATAGNRGKGRGPRASADDPDDDQPAGAMRPRRRMGWNDASDEGAPSDARPRGNRDCRRRGPGAVGR